MKDMVLVKSIGKNFGKQNVLHNVSFSVAQGEIFGLLGPSGAGKTTLLKILTGQIEQDSGQASILNVDINNIDSETYKKMGIMLEDCGLFQRLTCFANLYIFAMIFDLDKSDVNNTLKDVQLYEQRNKPVRNLSKGMTQRLSFGRAVLHKPKLLFLDEPSSGLDPVTANFVHDIIFNIANEGTTVIMTTHNMHEATKLCDNIGLLSEGEIIEYGKPKELINKYSIDTSIDVRLKNGKEYSFCNSDEGIELLISYLQKEEVVSIHSRDVTLEDIFIELTGRGLEG